MKEVGEVIERDFFACVILEEKGELCMGRIFLDKYLTLSLNCKLMEPLMAHRSKMKTTLEIKLAIVLGLNSYRKAP